MPERSGIQQLAMKGTMQLVNMGLVGSWHAAAPPVPAPLLEEEAPPVPDALLEEEAPPVPGPVLPDAEEQAADAHAHAAKAKTIQERDMIGLPC
jgi:hypothetical protein